MGSFQLSLTVLVRYRTWNIFKVGSWCLPNSDPNSNEPYSRYCHIFCTSPTRLSLSMVLLSSRVWVIQLRLKGSLITPHFLAVSSRIRFAFLRFRSLLLTQSRLISFPAGTKTLQSPALLTKDLVANKLAGSPIEEPLVQWPHAPTQSISLLAAPFIIVSSQVVHLMASVV